LQVYNLSKASLFLLFLPVINFLSNLFISKNFHQYAFFLIFGISFGFNGVGEGGRSIGEDEVELSCSLTGIDEVLLFVEFS
jgi:hypothetical protein